MLYSNLPSSNQAPSVKPRRSTLDQRIDELRSRPAAYLNHGEALLLQGMAAASLRPQQIVGEKITLDEK